MRTFFPRVSKVVAVLLAVAAGLVAYDAMIQIAQQSKLERIFAGR